MFNKVLYLTISLYRVNSEIHASEDKKFIKIHVSLCLHCLYFLFSWIPCDKGCLKMQYSSESQLPADKREKVLCERQQKNM